MIHLTRVKSLNIVVLDIFLNLMIIIYHLDIIIQPQHFLQKIVIINNMKYQYLPNM